MLKEKAQVSSFTQHDSLLKRRTVKKKHREAIDFLDPAYEELPSLPLLLTVCLSVLLGALGVILEEEAEGSEPEQKGLEEPQAASGCVGDPFFAAHFQSKQGLKNMDSPGSTPPLEHDVGIVFHKVLAEGAKWTEGLKWNFFRYKHDTSEISHPKCHANNPK